MCWHKWGKWGEPLDTVASEVKVQARECTKCGLVVVRKLKQPWNIWFSAAQLKGRS